jgi:hypothetical protein
MTVKKDKKMMTVQELKKLRNNLPRGYGRKVAEMTGKHTSAVYQTLTGKINCSDIIDAAITLAKEEAQRNEDIKNRLKAI